MTPEEQAAADAAAAAAQAQADADAAALAAAAAQSTTPPPITVDGLNEEQIRARLARATELEQAQATLDAAAETARQAALTEAERVAEEAATAARERDAAATALEAERTSGNNLRLEIAIQGAARDLNVQLHEAAIADSLALGEFAGVTFNDERQPQGVKEALAALLAKKPYLQLRVDAPDLGGHNAGRDTGLTGAAAALAAQAALTTTHGF